MKDRIYVPHMPSYAGKWIHAGYMHAWATLGYQVLLYSTPPDLEATDFGENDMIMIPDAWISVYPAKFLPLIKKSKKAFVQSQPNTFPLPWGTHPNFVSLVSDDTIKALNAMDNVYLWAFGDEESLLCGYHHKWKTVHSVPLAFDSINYNFIEDKNYMFDVCYIGGWANNGFNEKRKIMINTLSEFMKSGLKCGIFINKNISHDEENLILSNSKVAINIHDAYQRELGHDTNERTFKSLGLNGTLVSDEVTQLTTLFPEVKASNNPEEMIKYVKDYVNMQPEELNKIKQKNRKLIQEKHCYTHRVEKLLSL